MKRFLRTGIVLLWAASAQAQAPQLIHYQGRLLNGTNLVNGAVGLSLRLFNAPGGGSPQYEDSNTVTVADGLYATFLGDQTNAGSFAGALTNAQVWVEVAVNGTPLLPRERVAAVAYALMADRIRDGGVTGTMIADGTVAAADLDAASFSNTFWQTSGNAGTSPGTHFLGTTDGKALEIRVGGARVWRAEPHAISPVLLAGHPGNTASGEGSVIAGGGEAGSPNTLDREYGVIGGGRGNALLGTGYDSVIAGGRSNRITFYSSAIGGGYNNSIAQAFGAVIGGGMDNRIASLADGAAVGGGRNNSISGPSDDTVIGGGAQNAIAGGAAAAVIAGGHRNAIAQSSEGSAIGGGLENRIEIEATNAVIAGGGGNVVGTGSVCAVVAGGSSNRLAADCRGSAVGGGRDNQLDYSCWNSVIGGGLHNRMGFTIDAATISGGRDHVIEWLANGAVIGGGGANSIGEAAYYASIGGGRANQVGDNAEHSAVGGGGSNRIELASYAVIAGGAGNAIAGGSYATVPGGLLNAANASCSLAAGRRAKANHEGSFVWADSSDPADFASTGANQFLIRARGGVGIGVNNPGAALHLKGDAIIGGTNFTTSGHAAQLNLGDGNHYIRGVYAGGVRIGTFGAPDGITLLEVSGNVGIGTTSPTNKLHVAGNVTATGYYTASDRAAKENIEAVRGSDILERLAALPVARWNFRNEPGVRHIGPMAQDFRAAFGLGQNDTTIATVDADGVALAAIQALAQENAGLRRELDALKARLDGMEKR